MNTKVFSKAASLMRRAAFKARKHSPEICLALGIASGIGAVVTACVATYNLDNTLDEHRDEIDDIYVAEASGEISEDAAKKELRAARVGTGVAVVTSYLPAVGFGAASVIFILSGHNILRKRNAVVSAAFAALNTEFQSYREGVVEEYGEEVDKKLRCGVRKVEETRLDENGVETAQTVNVISQNYPYASVFAKFFDDESREYTNDPELNMLFLKRTEQMANDKLKADKFLFLNDVYEMLGIPKTKLGQLYGWIYDPEAGEGDNYVDFGIFCLGMDNVRDFMNGKDSFILLDFNVDGKIVDLFGKYAC